VRKAIIVGVLMFLDVPAFALSMIPPPQLGIRPIACFEWTYHRKKGDPEISLYRQWVFGYLSGWVSTRQPNQKTIHPNEIDDLLASIDHRCEVHPGGYVTYELEDLLHNRFDGKP
jgi:hypothetical protein